MNSSCIKVMIKDRCIVKNEVKRKKICFIAQFPPPVHGLSKAVDTLFNSCLGKIYDFEKIDITSNIKFLLNLLKIYRSKADLYYFTISQSKMGNIRDLIILKLLELQGKKCLIHLHGGYYRKMVENVLGDWQRKENYKAVKKLTGAIVLGPSFKRVFKGMIEDEKIYVVANCVDDDYLISSDDFYKKVINTSNHNIKHVLYLSNFIKEKGYHKCLELAKLEKERVDSTGEKRFHFNFAGKFFSKKDEEYFWKYIKKNSLDEFITYHGVVEGNKKRKLLRKCDVFILLTIYSKEGQPISILEAMGNGMFIVTTNHAGIPDIVQNEKNGIVVNVNKIDDVISIYQRMINLNNDAVIKVVNENREVNKKKFIEEKYVENCKCVIQSCLNRI